MFNKFFKLLTYFTITWFALYLSGCAPSRHSHMQKYFRDSIPMVSFNDLPKYKGQKVYLQGLYSGFEEYWSLTSLNGRYNKKLGVELEFKEGSAYIPKKYKSLFDSVYNSYWNRYLLIDAIGTFNNDSENGYGHLGSNNSIFVVSEVIDIQLYNKITHTKIPTH